MILTLLKHSRLVFWRSKTLGRSLGTSIFTWFMLGLILLYAIGLGVMLKKLITDVVPEQDVVVTLHGWLIFYWIFELILRLVLQNNISLNIQYYLTQNIRRKTLAHFMLIKSIKNLFLLITLLVFFPFAVSTIMASYSSEIGWAWIFFLLAISFCLHYLTIALQQSTKGNLLLPLILGLVLIGIISLNYWGLVDFSCISSGIMSHVLVTPLLVLVPLLISIGLYALNVKLVLLNLSLDSLPEKNTIAGTGISRWVAYLNSYGIIGQLMALELRLIWRNKRPRAIMVSGVFMLLYFIFFLFRMQDSMMVGIFLLISTGAFMVNYGQLLYSWESGYFDFIITRNISAKQYLISKLVLFLVFNTISLILVSTILVFIDITHLKEIVIWYFINSGVFTYVFIWGTMLGPKSIDANARAMFNYEGLNAFQFLIIIPYFLIPVGIAYLFKISLGEFWQDIILLTFGLSGILFYKYIINFLSIRFTKRKYKISNGFRE